MPGHIRKRGKESWAVVIDLGRDPQTGKRRRHWRSVKGPKRKAQELLVQLLHQRDTGIDVPPGKITVGEFLIQWLHDYVQPSKAPKTYRDYADVVQRHLIPSLGSLPLAKLRPQHIQSFYSKALREGRLDGHGGLSARTVLRFHHILHGALRQAVEWQQLASNPADAAKSPRPVHSEIGALQPSDARRLVEVADGTQYGPLVHLAVNTGMRVGELLGLRWRDVDLQAGALHVQQTCQWLSGQGFVFRQPKTARSRREVALSPETTRRLRQHRQRQLEERLAAGPLYQDHDLVFPTALGTPIEPANLRRAWLRIIQDAELGRLRFHDLRHTHATLLLQQGVHPKIVSERLGHASIAITLDTYSHVMPGLQAQAAAELDTLLASS
jgi:integrase